MNTTTKTPLDCLIDKFIKSVYLSECGHYLVFSEGDDGCDWETKWAFQAVGDCCSESYFNDILGVDNIRYAKVVSVIPKDISGRNKDDGKCYESSCIQFYGYTITTTKGYFDIVFRNESNGYYGGELVHMKKDPPYLQANFKELTEDVTN